MPLSDCLFSKSTFYLFESSYDINIRIPQACPTCMYLTMYIHKILHHYVLYASSPSERNQTLLSRDREIFLRISRTRQIAFPRSMIECRSFLPTLISHKDGGRQKGKKSEYWHERWARSLSTPESDFSFARFIAFSMQ